ncbi:glycosyltransferase [Thiohalorhabdus sp. Cl-TMA]|uniref:Glycosyltransferase n=1 Tax=Thiohalorhabdus methylotrophus TaxID=3242694 RepID=A0ABV4TWM3_9GAMM
MERSPRSAAARAVPREEAPRVVVLSHLFPHSGDPGAGLFIRERMFRVARHIPLVVVSPVPWFPFQGILRRFRPNFRPPAPYHEQQGGVDVYFPRYFSVPGFGKSLDGLFEALGALRLLRRLRRDWGAEIIDAHFAYPDGYAAGRLGRWLGLPVTVTLRGTEPPLARTRFGRVLLRGVLKRADRIFSVSASLQALARRMGASRERTRVIPNGVDTEKFQPIDRGTARRDLGIPETAPVIVSVGALVERKGFHRVMEVLPALREHFPGLRYLIVGGPGPEGDMGAYLRERVQSLGLEDTVHFLGPMAPEALCRPLSAADLFVLATSHEGWANVFLEAMACGLPVVTTDVGGNREVVSESTVGRIVPFGSPEALEAGLREALATSWDHRAIREYAVRNGWDARIATVVDELTSLVSSARKGS